MQQYQIKLQGQPVKTFASDNGYHLSTVQAEVRNAIRQGTVTVDHTKPELIAVVKV